MKERNEEEKWLKFIDDSVASLIPGEMFVGDVEFLRELLFA
jgi:hypothetical protein